MRQVLFIFICFVQTLGFSQNDTIINGSKNLLIKNKTIDTALLKKYFDGYWQHETNGQKMINHYEVYSDPKSGFDVTMTAITEVSPDTIIYIEEKMYFNFEIKNKRLAMWYKNYKNKKVYMFIDFLSDKELITECKYTASYSETVKSIKRTKGNFIK